MKNWAMHLMPWIQLIKQLLWVFLLQFRKKPRLWQRAGIQMHQPYRCNTLNDMSEKNPINPEANFADNLMKSCQADVFNLVKSTGMSKRDLEETKIKCETETRQMLLGFLGIIDSFNSRFDEYESKKKILSEETLNWISKFNITYKKLLNAIKECGITPIEISPGEIFNADLHNAVEIEDRSDKPDGSILQEIYRGYRWRGKLLRPTDVKITRAMK
ncbi:MAG: nucleotide exchange factor GrpE [Odoribacter sp.]|nr:nucleotide exchange factor GrpE [Odoribacter sp.]